MGGGHSRANEGQAAPGGCQFWRVGPNAGGPPGLPGFHGAELADFFSRRVGNYVMSFPDTVGLGTGYTRKMCFVGKDAPPI